jgi:alpha-L-rhamnosidase
MVAQFTKAQPIWLPEDRDEMNVQAMFTSEFTVKSGLSKDLYLLLSGASLFRVFINGAFCHYGPAKAGHGFTRQDTVDISSCIKEGDNRIDIEVSSYNCANYYFTHRAPFLQAEIACGNEILAATGEAVFSCARVNERNQNVIRYSFQRGFTEQYKTSKPIYPFAGSAPSGQQLKPVVVEQPDTVITNEVPHPLFPIASPVSYQRIGTVSCDSAKAMGGARYINGISEMIHGFGLDEIPYKPHLKANQLVWSAEGGESEPLNGSALSASLAEGEAVLVDFGRVKNGFIQSEIMASEEATVFFLFDEKLIDHTITIVPQQTINLVTYQYGAQEKPYTHETFESYGMRYLLVYCEKGSISLESIGIREYKYPEYRNAKLATSETDYTEMLTAAQETFAQNTIDVFMDCPTRERAGWLCDSYFTAQSAFYFVGDTKVEQGYLQNFILPDAFPNLPKGMLPMCSPSDQVNGQYIPQWSLWFVLELERYFKHNALANPDDFKPRVYDLFEFFSQYLNSDGLLEKLDSWNFVEWSEANEWVQDVNYPTNMLYTRALQLAAGWYNDSELKDQADRIRKTIIEQSFDGKVFHDQALRGDDGTLTVTDKVSEVCQYYAFAFYIADPAEEQYTTVLDLIHTVFGPDRREKKIMPEIAYANSLMGNYLRMELLLRWGEFAQLLGELKGYFLKMVELTGTLWEHDSVHGSLNHGFASYVGVAVLKAFSGIAEIDTRNKTVTVIDAKLGHDGDVSIAVTDGSLIAKRRKDGEKETVSYRLPDGYRLERLTQEVR